MGSVVEVIVAIKKKKKTEILTVRFIFPVKNEFHMKRRRKSSGIGK